MMEHEDYYYSLYVESYYDYASWFVFKVFMRIKELDVVSKRQQEEEGDEINVDHLWLDAEGDYSVF